MRRFLVALVAVSTLSVPLIAAHAADLRVDGGILQTFTVDVDIPPPSTVAMHVELGEYAGESGKPKGTARTLGPYVLTQGQPYHVEYDGQTRSCPGAITTPNQQTGGPFTASTDLTHVLCVQHDAQEGTVVVRAGSVDGPVIDPAASPPDDGP